MRCIAAIVAIGGIVALTGVATAQPPGDPQRAALTAEHDRLLARSRVEGVAALVFTVGAAASFVVAGKYGIDARAAARDEADAREDRATANALAFTGVGAALLVVAGVSIGLANRDARAARRLRLELHGPGLQLVGRF